MLETVIVKNQNLSPVAYCKAALFPACLLKNKNTNGHTYSPILYCFTCKLFNVLEKNKKDYRVLEASIIYHTQNWFDPLKKY